MSSDLGGEAGDAIRREDLPRFFADAAEGAAERDAPLIGVETEWLPVAPSTAEARPFKGGRGVRALFAGFMARGFEDPLGVPEPTHLECGKLTINLEPGGQVELSGAPMRDLHQVASELSAISRTACEAADDAGFVLLCHGIQPITRADEIRHVPKRRYDAMVRHFERHGGARFLDMMRLTGAVQVSLDYKSEEDAGRKLRASLLAAPAITALFAHSPIFGGRPTGHASERALVWLETDDARCGPVRCALEGAFSFERLVEELLDVPSIVARADDGGVRETGGVPFRRLLDEGLDGRPVTLADWELHLSTIFTDARLKRVLECRAADAPPPGATLSAPALYIGLVYDDAVLDETLERFAAFGGSYREHMRIAGVDGLKGEAADGRTLHEHASDLVALPKRGLEARGLGEERFLEPVERVLETGRTFADHALERFEQGGPAGLIEWARLRCRG